MWEKFINFMHKHGKKFIVGFVVLVVIGLIIYNIGMLNNLADKYKNFVTAFSGLASVFIASVAIWYSVQANKKQRELQTKNAEENANLQRELTEENNKLQKELQLRQIKLISYSLKIDYLKLFIIIKEIICYYQLLDNRFSGYTHYNKIFNEFYLFLKKFPSLYELYMKVEFAGLCIKDCENKNSSYLQVKKSFKNFIDCYEAIEQTKKLVQQSYDVTINDNDKKLKEESNIILTHIDIIIKQLKDELNIIDIDKINENETV